MSVTEDWKKEKKNQKSYLPKQAELSDETVIYFVFQNFQSVDVDLFVSPEFHLEKIEWFEMKWMWIVRARPEKNLNEQVW